MNEILKSNQWVGTRTELPGRLVIDRVYFIADEGVFLIDHGAGPVEFGSAGGGGENLYRGAFEDAAALRAAHPTDIAGAYATVLATGTLWIWNGTDWADSGKQSTEVEIVDDLTTAAADKALSARQGMTLDGKVAAVNEKLNTKASAAVLNLNVPVDAWIEDAEDTSDYPWHANILNAVISEDMIPFLSLGPAAASVALEAGLCSSMQTQNGAARIFAAKKPTAALSGTLMLIAPSGEILTDTDFATDEEVEDLLGDIWG